MSANIKTWRDRVSMGDITHRTSKMTDAMQAEIDELRELAAKTVAAPTMAVEPVPFVWLMRTGHGDRWSFTVPQGAFADLWVPLYRIGPAATVAVPTDEDVANIAVHIRPDDYMATNGSDSVDYLRYDGAVVRAFLAAAPAVQQEGETVVKCDACDGKGGFVTAEWTDPVSGPECEVEQCTDCEGKGTLTAQFVHDHAIEQAALLFPQPFVEYCGTDIQATIRALKFQPTAAHPVMDDKSDQVCHTCGVHIGEKHKSDCVYYGTAQQGFPGKGAAGTRKLVRYGDCKCILSHYCDGTCNPIWADQIAATKGAEKP